MTKKDSKEKQPNQVDDTTTKKKTAVATPDPYPSMFDNLTDDEDLSTIDFEE